VAGLDGGAVEIHHAGYPQFSQQQFVQAPPDARSCALATTVVGWKRVETSRELPELRGVFEAATRGAPDRTEQHRTT
jgi:hypothetical protein